MKVKENIDEKFTVILRFQVLINFGMIRNQSPVYDDEHSDFHGTLRGFAVVVRLLQSRHSPS